MKILITGSSGFLGGALVRSFSKDSKNHLILPLRPTSITNGLNKSLENLEVSYINEEYNIEELVVRTRPNVIIHTACSYGRKGESILQMLDVNLRMGLSILQALTRSPNQAVFINTSTVLAKNINLYALSKNNFAEWGSLISSESAGKIKFINVLLQHMYGPFDDVSKFPTYIIRSCIDNIAEINLTDGMQMRDFIYIEDVVNAYRLLVNCRDEIESQCNIDIGSGEALKIREFVETVHAITNSRTKLNFGSVPSRGNEQMLYQADIGRMLSLGWKPEFNIKQGLIKTIEQEFKK